MRKTHNLSSHHHPWEIQFVAVPLAPVHTKRVIATWQSLEHGVKPVLMCVACVAVFLSCIVCHSSFIFLLITRVIQCAGKWECSLKVKCMYMVLCVRVETSMKNETKSTDSRLQELGSTVSVTLVHFTSLVQAYLHSFHCVPPLSDFKRDLSGCSTTQRRRKLYSQTDMLMFKSSPTWSSLLPRGTCPCITMNYLMCVNFSSDYCCAFICGPVRSYFIEF